MADEYDDILDSTFHGCAWAAYFDQAAEEGRLPGRDATRRRAFRYYEEALAEKNRVIADSGNPGSPPVRVSKTVTDRPACDALA
jgi:hypothetical protein